MSYLSDRQYGLLSHRGLLQKLKNSTSITRRLKLSRLLEVHRGCVNTICWNDRGSLILSGSDDQHLMVTDPFTSQVVTDVHSGHRENIFSAKFLPETNDRRVVSCSGDGIIFHTNLDRTQHLHDQEGCFTCHGSATAYEVRVLPHTPDLFLSCSDDCTVRLYDLRTKSNCLKAHCNDDILIRSKWGITSIDVNPMNPNELVCACSDSSIRLYDHRKLSTQASTTSRRCEASINGLLSRFVLTDRKGKRPPRVTSVVFNQYGSEILASYSSESLYLLDPKRTLSQEESHEHLLEHRNEKRSRMAQERNQSALNEAQANAAAEEQQEKKTSQFKRLRLRGDWSDTGPDSRPSNEEEPPPPPPAPAVEPVPEPAAPPTTAPTRNIQNFFMQRMSDILTQLANRPDSENDEAETAPTPNQEPIAASPTVQLPPTSPSEESSADTPMSNNQDDNASEASRERAGFLDILFGGNRRRAREQDDDDENNDDDDNDNSSMDDDDEESAAATTTTNRVPSSGRARRPLMAAKWDRMVKRREAERSQEENLLKNVPSLAIINSYEGHRNARTMIKEANFWSDSHVMSGSDCGHIFIWNKFTGNIVRIINADKHVVNCVQPHPLQYPILASSGIDYDIKIFSPLSETPIDDSTIISSTVKRNHAMMEETSSTITVPATFMFRMLTSLYRLRRPEGLFGLDDEASNE